MGLDFATSAAAKTPVSSASDQPKASPLISPYKN
jgi:hypothetical protein